MTTEQTTRDGWNPQATPEWWKGTDLVTRSRGHSALLERINDLPSHLRERVGRRASLAIGYAWGRQDEAGVSDHEDSFRFALFAQHEAYEYAAEKRVMLASVQDQWQAWREV